MEQEILNVSLAITARIVELINGRIDVSSKLGEGSEFVVTLELESTGRAPEKEETLS